MIHLARLYAQSKAGDFELIEVPRPQAKHKKRELERRGYVITHTEIV